MKTLASLFFFVSTLLSAHVPPVTPPIAPQISAALPKVTVDPQAAAVLSNALAALGGASAYTQSGGAIVFMSQVEPFQKSHSVLMKDSWGGAQPEFRREFPGSPAYLVSNHGQPRSNGSDGVTQLPHHLLYSVAPLHLPGAVLNIALTDLRHSIKLLANVKVNGIATVHVRIWDATDLFSSIQSNQDWYFDATTFLPIQVEHRAANPDDGVKFTKYTLEYDRWQVFSGVAVPQQLIEHAPNRSRTVKSIDSVQFVPSFASTEFEAGGAQ